MPPVSDETLMAYADGQLSAPETEALRTQLAIDPPLRERLSAYVATRDLGPLYCDAMVRPVPGPLRDILSAPIGAGGRQVPAETHRETGGLLRALTGFFSPGRGYWALGVALSTTCLIIGSVGGWMASRHFGDEPATIIATAGDGSRLSSRVLDAALESRPSGTALALVDGTGRMVFSITPVSTFASKKEQRVCREYDLRTGDNQDGFAGVACRTGSGSWVIEKQVAFTFPKTSNVKPAQGARPLEELVERLRGGRTLTLDEERHLLSSGWNQPLPKQ